MDPLTGALIGGGISALGGILGSNSAADAQEEAARQSAETQRRNMLMQLGLAEPSRNLGYQAMGDLASLYGYGMSPYPTQQNLASSLTHIKSKDVVKQLRNGATVDQIAQFGSLGGRLNGKAMKRLTKAGLSMEQIQQLSAGGRAAGASPGQPAPNTFASPEAAQPSMVDRFRQLPGYQFALQEGTRDIGNSFAAKGGAASGNALRALNQFNSGLASQTFNTERNALMQMAGMGQVATGQAGNAAGQYANAQSASQMAQGDARASGIMGGVNSLGNAVNAGFNNYYMGQYLNRMPQPSMGTPPYVPPGLGGNQPGPWADGYKFPGSP
jgi:hypothetical protein